MKHNYFKKTIETPIWLLISTIAIVYSINIYYGNIYLNSLNEGDFGRDLYNFYLVSKGKLPYIDFNWIYGPLAPILYGISFVITGKSILSALNLWFIIYFIICITMYFTVKSFSNHFTAFLSTIFFIGYHGFQFNSFNHSIGIVFILLSILFLYKYLNSNNIKYLYTIALWCFLLNITKLNMGIAFSASLFGTLFLISLFNKNHLKPIFLTGLSSLLLTLFVYGSLLIYSPITQLPKNFPYLGSYHQYLHLSFIKKYFDCDSNIVSPAIFLNNITNPIYFFFSVNIWYFIIIFIGIIVCFFIYKKSKFNKDFIFIMSLSICAFFTTHEFLITTSFYSLRYWSLPIIIVLFLFITTYLINQNNTKTYFKPIFIILLVFFISVLSFKYYNIIAYSALKSYYYPHKRALSKMINIHWLLLTVKTVDYIEKNSKPGDKMLTLPYNTFYNFISDRDQPSRITEFTYISNINKAEEKTIIADMEKNKVKLILYSIRESDLDSGLGKFGTTHCQELYQYINENYYLDQIFDSIKNNESFLTPITFYKRKTPFKKND